MRRPHQRVEATPWIESLSLSRFHRDAAMGRSWSHRRQPYSDRSLSRGTKGVRLDPALGPQRKRVGGNRICEEIWMVARGCLAYSEAAILRRKVAMLVEEYVVGRDTASRLCVGPHATNS